MRNLIVSAFVFCVAFFIDSVVFGAQVHLAWDPSSGKVDGYRIYYGTTPGNHPIKIEVGNVTDYLVTGLKDGTTYYFVIRAYNQYGESGDSNEISWPNSKPVISSLSIAPNPASNPHQEIKFTVSASDSDGDALSYNFDFGDGSSSSSGSTVTHAYNTKGTYTVTATVSDNQGHSVSKTEKVVVNENKPVKVTGVSVK